MKNLKEAKKLNNKGFSLVELIIVIAIMAVLVGVLAPQYLKYVKQSKVSTDITNAEEIATAVNVAIADGTVTGSGTIDASNVATCGVPNMTAFPQPKVDSTYSWKVEYTTDGVKEITLGGEQIYPLGEAYKNANS